ncbi:MAG TPA: hypothetical protein VN940_06630 [Candidatus Dormibacteraeota bacterium]|nr:hypothetical protein [Candidatus Dormibacteraeota bacterium]
MGQDLAELICTGQIAELMQLLVPNKGKDARVVTQPRRGGSRKKPSALQHSESEDLSTISVEVARFWQEAYDELVRMEEQLLSQLESMLPRLSPAARREAELTNLPMINDHLQMFRYRRAHWKQRAEALNGQGSH